MPISIVELSCRSVREATLAKIGSSKMADGKQGDCEIQRAKTSLQLKRNGAVTKASDKLKQDPRNNGKTVKIAWKIDDPKERGVESKTRGVEVNGVLVFLQSPTDSIGMFGAPFQDMSL